MAYASEVMNRATVSVLHHIGYLVEDVSATADTFCDLWGYQLESEVIEDSVQTARVLFLRQPGSSSWIELISPFGKKSKLTHALKKGVTLHHLCYEVSDVESSCRRLREGGLFMLEPVGPGAAYPGRKIAWFMDEKGGLIELLESGGDSLTLL